MSNEELPDVITISSDQEDNLEDEDDIEIVELRRETQDLLENPQESGRRGETKNLQSVQCPICFDVVEVATVTQCGHIFCLECIQQSIASSAARGQSRGRKGVGLCPLCRKSTVFKDTIVLRMRQTRERVFPDLPGESGT